MTDFSVPKFDSAKEEFDWTKNRILTLQSESASMKLRISEAESAAFLARKNRTPGFVVKLAAMNDQRGELLNEIRRLQSRIIELRGISHTESLASDQAAKKPKGDRDVLIAAIADLADEIYRLREAVETLTARLPNA